MLSWCIFCIKNNVFAKIKLIIKYEEVFMKDCVIISMALGFIAGALLVSNNSKAQHIVDIEQLAKK